MDDDGNDDETGYFFIHAVSAAFRGKLVDNDSDQDERMARNAGRASGDGRGRCRGGNDAKDKVIVPCTGESEKEIDIQGTGASLP